MAHCIQWYESNIESFQWMTESFLVVFLIEHVPINILTLNLWSLYLKMMEKVRCSQVFYYCPECCVSLSNIGCNFFKSYWTLNYSQVHTNGVRQCYAWRPFHASLLFHQPDFHRSLNQPYKMYSIFLVRLL